MRSAHAASYDNPLTASNLVSGRAEHVFRLNAQEGILAMRNTFEVNCDRLLKKDL